MLSAIAYKSNNTPLLIKLHNLRYLSQILIFRFRDLNKPKILKEKSGTK